MRYTVIDEFNSLTRRFAPGMEIDASEIDGAVPVERWIEMDKIKEAKPVKPDLASDQAAMRAAWETSGELVEGGPIRIVDHELFGTLRSDLDGGTVDVIVFGEDFARRYSRASVDVPFRAVSGDFTEERVTRRAQAATVAAARERVNVDPPAVVPSAERAPSA